MNKRLLLLLVLTYGAIVFAGEKPLYEVVRIGDEAIVSQEMFTELGAEEEGENINGPSVIRIPDWIAIEHRADPTANYYLYFAHHSDDYIRMAWAAEVKGPWHLYNVGSGVASGERGVLDHGGQYINLANGISIEDNHLASPDAIVDHENQRIILYFHSGSSTFVDGEEVNKQVSWVSTSPYGLDFYDGIESVFFGPSYFRIFDYDNAKYTLTNNGTPYRAPSITAPWTAPLGFDYTSYLWDKHPDNPFQKDIDSTGLTSGDLRVRHTGVRVVGDQLHVFYSRRGDAPERIQMSTIDMSVGDWEDWDATYPPLELMTAKSGWEGGQYEVANSETSSAPENVNQLRDPYVFEDDNGSLYLFYTGCGEDGIGVAHLIYNDPLLATQVYLKEDFDYNVDTVALPSDTITASAITGWYNARDREEYITISETPLTYAGYNLTGVGKAATIKRYNGQEIQKSFSGSITEGSFYLAFMLNVTEGKNDNGDPFVRLVDASGATQLDFDVQTIDGLQYYGLTDVLGDSAYALNITRLFVMKYTFAGTDGSVSDSAVLFIDPSLSEEPSVDTAQVRISNAITEISAIQLRCRQKALQGNIGGIIVTESWDDLKAYVASDDVEVSLVSADTESVSYETITFMLKDGTDDIYLAHDSIAYGDDAVTIFATPAESKASVSYTKRTLNPAVGASDTAVFIVTAEDGVSTKTYKVVMARSHYQCKQGFYGADQYDLTTGWSKAGKGNNVSGNAGNNGLFYGSRVFRFWTLNDGDIDHIGNLISPKFSKVGSIAFSAKFSKTADEVLIIEKSTDDGATWSEVKRFKPDGGEFPSYDDEQSESVFGRQTLAINALDVQLQFRVEGTNTSFRTSIDDLAINASDYSVIATVKLNSATEESFTIYPNPASTYIQIQGDVSNVSIYSLYGHLVKQSFNEERIDIQSLESGIYLVKAGNSIKQLIVE